MRLAAPSVYQDCAYSIKILISLSFNLAFRKMDSIFQISEEVVVGRALDVRDDPSLIQSRSSVLVVIT
jgi:hypothetical protein